LKHARVLGGSLEGRAEVAVREEMARTLPDAILRRLDAGTGGPPSDEDRETVLSVLSSELGWDAERQAREREALNRAYARGAPCWP